MTQVLAIIPARSGSKSVKDKNIRLLNNKPLIAYSIEQALESNTINRIIVSTDSEYYADIARNYGAEVPFIRPSQYATDDSTDLDVFLHTLTWLREEEGYIPDVCVHLRPTHPVREIADINLMVQKILNDNNIDSVRSVSIAKETPYKMWFIKEDGCLESVIPNEKELYNMPRQQLPKAYSQNACIDVIRTSVIMENKSMTGSNIAGHINSYNFDIDTEADFERAETYIKLMQILRNDSSKERNTFCFDIDGVIASIVHNNDYNLANPITETIRTINYLYKLGHTIILFTARGYVTGIDWEQVTKEQMRLWNVNYHKLMFGKPAADFYIDDKLISSNEISRYLNTLLEGEIYDEIKS